MTRSVSKAGPRDTQRGPAVNTRPWPAFLLYPTETPKGTSGLSPNPHTTNLEQNMLWAALFILAAAGAEGWSAFNGGEAWSCVHTKMTAAGAGVTQGGGAQAGRPAVLIIGGTGRIGTAVAGHLLSAPSGRPGGEETRPATGLHVVLAGRSASKGRAAIEEVKEAAGGADALAARGHVLAFQELDCTDSNALERVLTQGGGRNGMAGFEACVHTAGPFFKGPRVLRSCIKAKTQVVCLDGPLLRVAAAAFSNKWPRVHM